MPRSSLVPLGVLSFIAVAFAATPARAAVPIPGQVSLETVDFERHVMGLFSKAGCNAGSCHGSFQGKNGFRLSLFGYDPAKDYAALTRDALGRRLDPVEPDRSLLLLKATGQVDHGGGRRFDKGSWQYRLLRDWIAAGARWTRGSGAIAGLTVTPPECHFAGAGAAHRLAVRARFA